MKRFLLFTLVIIVIALITLFIRYGERGKQYAIAYLVEQIEEKSDLHVRLGNIHFTSLLHIGLDHVELLENEKTVAAIDHIDFQISPWELWHHNLVFRSVDIGKISLFQPLLTDPPPVEENTLSSDFFWDKIPFYIKIMHLQINEILLEKTLAPYLYPLESSFFGTPFGLSGSFFLDPMGKMASVDFSFQLQKLESMQIVVNLTQITELLDIQARLSCPNLSHCFQQEILPKDYSIQCFFQASALPDTWKQLLNDKTSENESKLNGNFQLSYKANSPEASTPDSPSLDLLLLGHYGSLKGLFTLNTAKEFSLRKIQGVIGPLLVEGKFALDKDHKIDGTLFSVTSRDFSPLEKWFHITAKGELKAECTLSGELEKPTIFLTCLVDPLEINHHSIKNVQTTLFSSYTSNGLDGELSFNSTIEQQEIRGFTHFNWDLKQQLALSDLKIESSKTVIQGNVLTDLAQKNFKGDLEGQADLSHLSHFFEQQFFGLVDFHSSFSSKEQLSQGLKSTQLIDFIMHAPDMQIGDYSFQEAQLNASVLNPLENPVISFKMTAQQGKGKEASFKNFSATSEINSALKEWPFTVACESDYLGQASLKSKGVWYHTQGRTLLHIQSMEGIKEIYPFSLKDPIHLTIEPKGIELSPFSFSLGDGYLYASIHYTSSDVNATIRSENIPVGIFRFIHSFPSEGVFSSNITLTGPSNRVEGHLQIDLKDIKFHSDTSLIFPPLNAHLQADLTDALIGKGTITGLSPNPIELNARLPLEIDMAQFNLAIDKDKPLAVHFTAEGQLASFFEMFAQIPSISVSGDLKSNLDITGSLNTPSVTGFVGVTNGSFEDLDLGTFFKNIRIEAVLKERMISLTTLSGSGAKGGTLTGKGSGEIDLNKNLPFEIALDIDKVQLISLENAHGTASGKLVYKGSTKGAFLEGKLVADSTEVVIPKHVPDLVDAVDVTYINQPSHEKPPTQYVEKKKQLATGAQFTNRSSK